MTTRHAVSILLLIGCSTSIAPDAPTADTATRCEDCLANCVDGAALCLGASCDGCGWDCPIGTSPTCAPGRPRSVGQCFYPDGRDSMWSPLCVR